MEGDDNVSIFSKNLKYIRNKRNLSQSKLGEYAKVDQATIGRWENEIVSPSLDNIYDLATNLNIPIADLTGKDLSSEENDDNFDELELLFSKTKDILTEDDRDMIRFVIEKRKKEIDKQLDNQ